MKKLVSCGLTTLCNRSSMSSSSFIQAWDWHCQSINNGGVDIYMVLFILVKGGSSINLCIVLRTMSLPVRVFVELEDIT